jgi:hypothetical protein
MSLGLVRKPEPTAGAVILPWPPRRQAIALARRRAEATKRAIGHLAGPPYEPGFAGRWTDDDAAIILALAWRITRAAERAGKRGQDRFRPSWVWTAWLNA